MIPNLKTEACKYLVGGVHLIPPEDDLWRDDEGPMCLVCGQELPGSGGLTNRERLKLWSRLGMHKQAEELRRKIKKEVF